MKLDDRRPGPIEWLYDLQHFGIKLGLDNIRTLLGRLDRPDTAVPSIHVGGTNGKGSVAAMLAAMLDAHGLASGLFTSPHLVRPNERIRLAGRDIDDATLHSLLTHVRVTIERSIREGKMWAHPSFFEVVTATALCAFREAGAAAAVLEVGLGGRLDATNAVEAEVSVIVNVGLDHMKTLGPTLERIAREKAGIVKPGRPLVTAAIDPRALDVLRATCEERGAPLIHAPSVATLDDYDGGRFAIATAGGRYRDLTLPLAGKHQRENARVAVVALERFLDRRGLSADPAAVAEGLGRVRWPGRLQWIDGEPPVLLDGAHNADGARTLADFLRERPLARPPLMVFGAMRGKQSVEMLEPLAGLVERVWITRPGVARSAEPEELEPVVAGLWDDYRVVVSPAAAFREACAAAAPGQAVLVAGSLYLVGEILGVLERYPVPGPVPM